MPLFLDVLGAYRNGVLSEEELLRAIDQELGSGQVDPRELLAIIADEHRRSPLPDAAHQALLERVHRAPTFVDFTAHTTQGFSMTASGSSDDTVYPYSDPTQPVHALQPFQAHNPDAAAPARKPLVALGTVLKRRFRLIEKIGEGGMSAVYKAVDLRRVEARATDVHVAVKILTLPNSDFAHSMEVLQREAQTLQRLPHPNIVRVIDCDRDGRTVFMTMENLSGESLKRKLIAHEHKGMPAAEAVRIIRGIAEGLAFAHRYSIIHGDLKPGNVFITQQGEIKIIDFGIARLMTRDPGVTIAGDERPKLSALTPPYASPEMLEGGSPDPRDDVYALGCIAYETLTGRHPFDRLVANDARDSGLRPARSGSLSAAQYRAISRALQFDRSERTSSAEQFLQEFTAGAQRPVRGIATAVVLVLVAVAATAILWWHSLGTHAPTRASAGTIAAAVPLLDPLFRDCPTCPLMHILPPARFQQGDADNTSDGSPLARPQHAVAIGYAFGLGVYEITVGEYKEFVDATHRPSSSCTTYDGAWNERAGVDWSNTGFKQTSAHPVVCVSWGDATDYADWISQKTGQHYRLPSDSEWEYAARAGSSASRPWSDRPDAACGSANVADQTAARQFPGWNVEPCSDGFVFTAPVGSFAPNAFGLYDMLGNAFEWVQDCWNPDYQQAPTDGSARLSGDCSERGLRGGSWFTSPELVSVSARNRFGVDYRSSSIGFRVVREVPR
jgi:formylglycine-generating enzyme required for sulfatase activity